MVELQLSNKHILYFNRFSSKDVSNTQTVPKRSNNYTNEIHAIHNKVLYSDGSAYCSVLPTYDPICIFDTKQIYAPFTTTSASASPAEFLA
jgi:hypothetical protein